LLFASSGAVGLEKGIRLMNRRSALALGLVLQSIACRKNAAVQPTDTGETQAIPPYGHYSCGGVPTTRVVFGANLQEDLSPCTYTNLTLESPPTSPDTASVPECPAAWSDSVVTDYHGEIVQAIGGQVACLVDQPLDEWCRAELPCWQEMPTCPNFLEFLAIVAPAAGETGVERRVLEQEGCTGDGGLLYDAVYLHSRYYQSSAIFQHEDGKLLEFTVIYYDSYFSRLGSP
jgi:hypothetical protein